MPLAAAPTASAFRPAIAPALKPPKMRASTSPRRSPRLAAGATQLVQPNRTASAIAAATATRTPGLALPVVPGSLGTRVKGPDTSIGGALSRGA